LFASLALLGACKKDSGGAAPAGSGASSAPVAVSASAAPAPAKADVGYPAGVKMSPPKAKQVGGTTIQADVCKLDKRGADMKDSDFANAIKGLAPAPDGGVYVVDNAGSVRKYLVQSPSPCELALDQKFGTGGILAVEPDAKKAKDYDTVQIDSKGTLYVSGYQKVQMVTADGKVTKICDDSGHFYVDRITNDMYFNGKKVTLNGTKCDSADIKWVGWVGQNQPELIDAAGGTVFVSGSVAGKDKSNTDKVGAFKSDGTKVALVGEKDGDGDICYAAGAQNGKLGLYVYDSNCRSLRVWATDGTKLIGVADLNELFGVSYSWPVKLVIGKDTSWAVFSQQGEGDKAPNFGFVARISGLN
jgi:hypothetical protein